MIPIPGKLRSPSISRFAKAAGYQLFNDSSTRINISQKPRWNIDSLNIVGWAPKFDICHLEFLLIKYIK